MLCEDVEKLLIDTHLQEQLTSVQLDEIKEHVHICTSCTMALKHMKELFLLMHEDRVMVPSKRLREKFVADLAVAITEKGKKGGFNLRSLADIFTLRQAAAAILLLLLGATAGILIRSPWNGTLLSTKDIQREMYGLKNELREVKKLTALNMLKEASASDRLRGVSFAEEIELPDTVLIKALIYTLNEDESVHVRIAAASSLEVLVKHTGVMEALLQSLGRQDEPMVQIMLIQMLTRQQEKRALQPIKRILQDDSADDEVKKAAQKSIELLL